MRRVGLLGLCAGLLAFFAMGVQADHTGCSCFGTGIHICYYRDGGPTVQPNVCNQGAMQERQVYVAYGDDGVVEAFSRESVPNPVLRWRRELTVGPNRYHPFGIAWTTGGPLHVLRRLFIGVQNGFLDMVNDCPNNPQSCNPDDVAHIATHTGRNNGIAISEVLGRVIVGGDDGRARSWDPELDCDAGGGGPGTGSFTTPPGQAGTDVTFPGAGGAVLSMRIDEEDPGGAGIFAWMTLVDPDNTSNSLVGRWIARLDANNPDFAPVHRDSQQDIAEGAVVDRGTPNLLYTTGARTPTAGSQFRAVTAIDIDDPLRWVAREEGGANTDGAFFGIDYFGVDANTTWIYAKAMVPDSRIKRFIMDRSQFPDPLTALTVAPTDSGALAGPPRNAGAVDCGGIPTEAPRTWAHGEGVVVADGPMVGVPEVWVVFPHVEKIFALSLDLTTSVREAAGSEGAFGIVAGEFYP